MILIYKTLEFFNFLTIGNILFKNKRFYGVMVITLDSESSNPSSSLGRTFNFSNSFSKPNF